MAYYRLPEKEIRAYCEAVMGKYGFNEKQSRDIADILLTADLQGLESHGVQRLIRYHRGVKSGVIRPDAVPEVVHETPLSVVLDAHSAMGQIAAVDAMERAIAKAKQYGIAPNRIHIDPLVEMLCTSENGIETNVEVISTVREKYPSIHITAAVSNISFNLPVRKMVNLGFTVLAMNAGLDSAILDPTNRDMMGVIYATEALLGLDDYCMEYIGAYRDGLFGPVK